LQPGDPPLSEKDDKELEKLISSLPKEQLYQIMMQQMSEQKATGGLPSEFADLLPGVKARLVPQGQSGRPSRADLPASLPGAGDAIARMSKGELAEFEVDEQGLRERVAPILSNPALDGIKSSDPALASAMDLFGRIEDRGARNPLVEQGLRGADVLGLRRTENSNEVSLRDQGTLEERSARLTSRLDLGEGTNCIIDDSWEDETGFVRAKAKLFKNKGHFHQPEDLPPGTSPLRPSLPLLYTLMGEPADPPSSPNMSKAEVKAVQMEKFAKQRDPVTGKFQLGIAEALSQSQAHEAPGWHFFNKPIPALTQLMLDTVLGEGPMTAICWDLIATSRGNPVNAKIKRVDMQNIIQGNVKWLRITNFGDFKPQPKSHAFLTWSEILGQHCSAFFECAEAHPELHREIDMGSADDMGFGGIDTGSTELDGSSFKISFLEDLGKEEAVEEHTDYCVNLIKTRFAQFEEYLDRKPEHRQCTMCGGPGAECIPITIGDYEITGMEWDDPHCWHMACRYCISMRMVWCDLGSEAEKQRCTACGELHGGYQIHNDATKKLMLMQAAQQVILFFGPRRAGEQEATFDEERMRRACIQATIDYGYMPACKIIIGANKMMELRGNDIHTLSLSGAWSNFAVLNHDHESTGYDHAALHGRLLLKMCEAEAMLQNYDLAERYADKAAEELSKLERGSPCDKLRRRHPAREFIIPARQVAKKMAANSRAKKSRSGGGAESSGSGAGGGAEGSSGAGTGSAAKDKKKKKTNAKKGGKKKK
jgi:hypothetical protein